MVLVFLAVVKITFRMIISEKIFPGGWRADSTINIEPKGYARFLKRLNFVSRAA